MRPRGAARVLLLALGTRAAAKNATGTGTPPGCARGWAFAPPRQDWPKGGAPGQAGHWSSACGYRHFSMHRRV